MATEENEQAVANEDVVAEVEQAGIGWFQPEQHYQIFMQGVNFAAQYVGPWEVDEMALSLLIFRADDGTVFHIRPEYIMAYFPVTAQQIARAKRAEAMKRMQVVAPPPGMQPRMQ